jgi:Matrixin
MNPQWTTRVAVFAVAILTTIPFAGCDPPEGVSLDCDEFNAGYNNVDEWSWADGVYKPVVGAVSFDGYKGLAQKYGHYSGDAWGQTWTQCHLPPPPNSTGKPMPDTPFYSVVTTTLDSGQAGSYPQLDGINYVDRGPMHPACGGADGCAFYTSGLYFGPEQEANTLLEVDIRLNWATAFSPERFRYVMLHEFGHAAGLQHVYSGCSLMSYAACDQNRAGMLSIADVQGLYGTYGHPVASP